ncbi:MAG: hypothetical protein IPJ03_10165 [Ignavibacteriales bacterium]|nr:hypothetical protein [Ignavibacteriales bacterium]
MKPYIFSILFFCLTAVNLFSQSAGLNFTLAFPMGEFKENVDRVGFGIAGQFLFIIPKPGQPFGIGLNAGFINYGNETRREPFSYTIPDVFVDVERSNNLVNFHLLFQIAPYKGRIRPYLEGLFGGSYLFTETSIKSQDYSEVASSTNLEDFAWSYGGGAGIMIQITNENEQGTSIFLDIKGRYLMGTEAEYLNEGSIEIIESQVYYDITRSKTDLLSAHLGVIAFF